MIAAHLLTNAAEARSAAATATTAAASTGTAFSSLLATSQTQASQTLSTGASVWSGRLHAKADKKVSETAAAPYVAAAVAAQPTATAAPGTATPSTGASAVASGTASTGTTAVATAANALAGSLEALTTAPAQAAAAAGTQAAAQAKAAQANAAQANGGSANGAAAAGVKGPPGSAELNARIAAGAPLLHSQPALSLATLTPEALESAGKSQTTSQPPASDGTDPSDSSEAPTANAAKTADAAAPPTDHAAIVPTPADNNAVAAAATGAQAIAARTTDADDSDATDAATNATATAAAAAANATQTTTDAAASTAPAAPTAGTPQTPLSFAPAADQVAISLKQAATDGSNSIKMQLKPESLGAIDVKLNIAHDGRVTAVISADRSDTLNMLKQDSGTLQQALRDAGLQADSNSLSFNLSNNPQPNFSQNMPQQSGNARSGAAADAEDDEPSIAAVTASPSLSRHAGRLDIQV